MCKNIKQIYHRRNTNFNKSMRKEPNIINNLGKRSSNCGAISPLITKMAIFF